MLLRSLDETAKLVEMERKQTALVEALNSVLILFYNTQGNMLTFQFEYMLRNRPFNEKDAEYRERALTSFAQLKSTLYGLSGSTGLTTNQRAFMTRLLQIFEQGFREMDSLANRPSSADQAVSISQQFASKMKTVKRATREGARRSEELLATVDSQKNELEKVRRQEKHSREAVNDLVIKGLIANLVVVIALVFFFIRDISSRLAALVQNAQRLPKRQSLVLVGGTDELSYLDQAMHKAAQELQQAFDHRQSVMQMVAHDLRSPLSASQISLDILSEFESKNLSPSGCNQVERIRANNRRLLALINDLLTIDLIELGKLELGLSDCDISKLANDAMQTIDGLALAKDIEITNSCNELYIAADRNRIVQVLVNFLSNAIKFSPPKSRIEITAAKSFGSVVVSVVDQGVGMTEQDSKQVFEKFYQAAEGPKQGGFGLGLAICRLIVESHKGRIGVESQSGKGSRFWFSVDESAKSPTTSTPVANQGSNPAQDL